MKLFQIDYKRLVLLLLPTFLRQPRVFAFLTAMTFGISELHGKFTKQRSVNLLRLKRNGQVCYLRGLLNDELDVEERRITILEGETTGEWLLAWSEEVQQQLLIDAKTIVYGEGLIIGNTAIFIVFVPWTESEENKTNRLKSLLNEYKLLSKKYTVRYE